MLVVKLLGHVTARPPPPKPASGLLRRLGSAAKSVLLLPYTTLTYLLAAMSM